MTARELVGNLEALVILVPAVIAMLLGVALRRWQVARSLYAVGVGVSTGGLLLLVAQLLVPGIGIGVGVGWLAWYVGSLLVCAVFFVPGALGWVYDRLDSMHRIHGPTEVLVARVSLLASGVIMVVAGSLMTG